jgi:hypothetical protein
VNGDSGSFKKPSEYILLKIVRIRNFVRESEQFESLIPLGPGKMKHLVLLILMLCIGCNFSYAQDSIPPNTKKRPNKSFLIDDRPFTFEIPIWIPGFAGDFAFGDISISGGDGIDPGDPEDPDDDEEGNILQKIFTPKFYLKFFYLTRMAYEDKNFLVQLDGITGGVGESIKFNYNNAEIVKLEFVTINLRLLAGYRVVDAWSQRGKFRYELYPYIGSRYHNQKIRSWFLDEKDIFDIQPGWFEPILGVQNQFSWERWFILLSADMGGFFIGSKYSFQLSSHIYYRLGRATSIKLGWNILDLNHRTTYRGEELKIDLTLGGPAIGFAIQF